MQATAFTVPRFVFTFILIRNIGARFCPPWKQFFLGLKFTQKLPVQIDISHISPMRDILYLQKINPVILEAEKHREPILNPSFQARYQMH